MQVRRIDDVQLAMPADGEADAIAFYEGVLGILVGAQVPAPRRPRRMRWLRAQWILNRR